MLRWIVRTSLRFRLMVIGLAVGIAAVGVIHLRDAKVDVLPEFTPPYVEIQTEALGLSAEEVEQLITVPLEADLLNGVQGVDVIRSSSVPGMSSIVLVFDRGADLYRSRQLVQERLTQAHALPNVSKPPTMLQPLSSSSRLLMIGLSGKQLSPIEKSVIARWTVRPRLMGVDGVANVAMWGLRDQQLQVQVDPRELRDRGITLNQVIRTAGNAQVVSPVSFLEASTPGTGGFIETPHQRLQVRNVFDNIASPADLGKVPIEGTRGRLRLTDVSHVVQDHQPLIGDAVVGEGEGLLLVVEKFPGANTREVTAGVEAALDKLRPGLGGMRTDTSLFRPAAFIDEAVGNLRTAIVIGAALLALALAAVLLRWRTVALALVTIPVSLIAAALVLDTLGESFNAISFAGLAIALVVVIDEAVAGAAHLARRGAGAAHEIRSPLAYATLIALLAVVPVAVMQGRPGAFFSSFALAYALAVAAAMAVALTLTPAMGSVLFARAAPAGGNGPIAPRYGGALTRLLHRPGAVAIGVGACLMAGVIAVPLLATSVVPSFKDRDVLVRLDGPPGTSNPRMTAIATDLSRKLRAVPGVGNVGAHVGRAVTGDQIVDVNSSELWVSIDKGADHDATLRSINAVVDGVRGVDHDVVTYSQQKIRDVGALSDGANPARGRELDVLTGAGKPLVVRVYGQDLGVLRTQAERVRRAMAGVDGVVAPRVQLPAQQPTLEIEVDLDRAQARGIKPGDVHRAEATLLQGMQVGSVFKQQKVFDVVVQGTPATRASVASVRDLLLDRPGGGHVRLGDVADVRVAPAPTAIQRDAVSRRLDIAAGIRGRTLAAITDDVQARLAGMPLPLEYHAEVLQRTTASEIGRGRILAFALAAAIAMFLLMQAAFRSWRLALIAFLTLPVALVGGAVASLVDGAEVSLGSAIAFLGLFALAARNALVLVRRLQELEREEGSAALPALIRRGAAERLAPVLATALGVAAVALPVVIMGAEPGLEIVHPMAVVLLGGLVSTTFVALFILPALYGGPGASPPAQLAPEEEVLYRYAGVPDVQREEGERHAPTP